MTKEQVMNELEKYGSEQTRKTWKRHGAREPYFGVKVGDMKKIVKKIKKDHELSLQLFDTGNADAMYLAGLIADEKQITKEHLQNWVRRANWYMLSEYTVPWIAAESRYGYELALEWIASEKESIAASGWATLASLVSVVPDQDIDAGQMSRLLDRVEKKIHESQNRVRYAMNNFLIATGTYVEELTGKAIQVAENIGKVSVSMGDTACKVPEAAAYIQKVRDAGRVGKKRKMARC